MNEQSTIIGVCLAAVRNIPNTAASKAIAAQSAAEEAATLAQQHSVGFEDGGTGLILKPIAEEA